MEQKKYYKRITNGSFYIGGQRYQKDEVFEAFPRQISSNFSDIIKQVNADGSIYDETKKVVIENKEDKKEENKNVEIKVTNDMYFLKEKSKAWYDVVDVNGAKYNEKALRENKAKELIELLNSQI